MINSPMLKERRAIPDNKNVFTPFSLTTPISVAINPFLTNTEKQLFSWIQNMAGSSSGCSETNTNLALQMGKCEQTITNSISNLVKYKYLDSQVKWGGYTHAERSIYIDMSFHERYQEAVTFFYDNHGGMNTKELKEKLGEIITKAQLATIKKIIHGPSPDTNPTIKKVILTTNTNINTLTSIITKPFLNEFKKEFSRLPSEDISPSSLNPRLVGGIQADLELEESETPPVATPKPPVHKFNRPKPPSIVADATNGINNLMSSMAQDNHSKYIKNHKTSIKIIPEDTELLIEHWESLGYRKVNKIKASKTFNKNVSFLKKIQNGTLIMGETRKFSPIDIQEAMNTFAKITFDDKYGPNKEIKKKFSEMYLHQFLFNPHSTKGVLSKFIACYEEKDPKEKTDLLPDKHPEVTKKLENFFFAYPLAGIKKKLTDREENHFRLATSKLDELWTRKGHRFCGITRGVHELGDLLCSSLRAFYGDKVSRIVPGSFSSSFAMSNLIKYMNEQGYFTDNESNKHWEMGQ